MPHRIKRWLIRYYQDNFLLYFIMIIMFIIGIVAGAITIKVIGNEKNNEVILFMNSFFKALDDNNLNSMSILKQSIIDNYKAVILIWLTGILYVGVFVAPVIVLFRGFAIGFSVGFFVHEYGLKGFLFSVLGIFPQNLIIVPSIISIATIGTNYSLSNIKEKQIRAKSSKFSRIIDYTFFILAFSLVLLIGCLIEAYLAPIFLRFLIDYLN